MKTSFDTSNPWEAFTYSIDLDVAGRYWMFWTPDDETKTVTFEVIFSRITVYYYQNVGERDSIFTANYLLSAGACTGTRLCRVRIIAQWRNGGIRCGDWMGHG